MSDLPIDQPPSQLAAVDLGSNSFHMIVARVVDGDVQVIDKLRERVGLAEALDKDGHLKSEGFDRALDTLTRFGQRLRGFPKGAVRAVGTNTLRKAKNADKFLAKGRKALGYPIEIISGREEARLVYQGVARTIEADGARRLVVDIGGGSTECIVGEKLETLAADSFYMGCVTFSMRFFKGGRISRKRMQAARTGAGVELQSVLSRYKNFGWDRAVGSSGTVLAVANILHLQGWADHAITRKGLKRLSDYMIDAGHVDNLKLEGLAADRAKVLPGGVAVLRAIFDDFGLEQIEPSTGALREGLLFDLAGRLSHHDVREQTVATLCDRYRVDIEQAERVEGTALKLFDELQTSWELGGTESRNMLRWAARLHECGQTVAYSGYHKHGAYLLGHGELAGFSKQDQAFLAALVRGHRRKLARSHFAQMQDPEGAFRICVLLRLAVLLNRNRNRRAVPRLELDAEDTWLRVTTPEGWLDAHPLLAEDLMREQARLESADLEFECE